MSNKLKSGTHRTVVDFRGLILECEFYYSRGFDGDMTDPPYPESVEISTVKHRDSDITVLIEGEVLKELEGVCVERAKDALYEG